MKLMIGRAPYGWRMYGLLGAGALWFLGFSRAVPVEIAAIRTQDDECRASVSGP